MILTENSAGYWFKIEPYVHISIANNTILLYNTLDGVYIECEKSEIVELLQETIEKDKCGVILLTLDKYKQKTINKFITELREKHMGDLIAVDLSKGKPVQVLPLLNLTNHRELYKKHNFSSDRKILEFLFEISIHVDHTIHTSALISFLQSLPKNITINIVGNLQNVTNYIDLLSFLDQYSSMKNLLCSYTHVVPLPPAFNDDFSYKIFVDFPIIMESWNNSRQILLNQTIPFEYVFNIASIDEGDQAEELIELFEIEKCHMNVVYTGENNTFFEENIFLTKEDILSTSMSIKDFFSNQAMNIYDFGKIHIMPNGNAYANINHPVLGNIYAQSIYEIISKEIEDGKSWFNIRNHSPCNTCLYQWLCPPPSNYEIAIDRPNLCHVKQ